MSSHPKPNLTTFLADAAISKGMAVKIGTNALHVAKCSAATQGNIGLAYSDAVSAEDPVEVAMPGGGALGLLGGSVSAGNFLVSDSAGKLVATSSANDDVVAQALSDGVANDLIPVSVVIFNY